MNKQVTTGSIQVRHGDQVQFRFVGDGEGMIGTVKEVFTTSPITIDGREEEIAELDLPCAVVECDDTGNWIVPIYYITEIFGQDRMSDPQEVLANIAELLADAERRGDTAMITMCHSITAKINRIWAEQGGQA